MTNCIIKFLLIIITIENAFSARKLPTYIEICKRTDPELSACLRKNVELIRPHLLPGIPDLQLPPLNPLEISEATLNSGAEFNAVFKNIRVFYADEYVLDKVDFDPEKLHCDIEIHFARMRIMADFRVKGKILVLQLDGQGPADLNFTNVVGKMELKGKLVERKSKEYLDWFDKQIDMDVGRPVFRFEKIFGDNEQLNEQTNKIVNENVEILIGELKPVIKQVVTEFLFGVLSRVFHRFTYEELFPK